LDPVDTISGRNISSYLFSKLEKSNALSGIGSILDSRIISSPAHTMNISGPVLSVIVESNNVL
jgi:hypothetical protein